MQHVRRYLSNDVYVALTYVLAAFFVAAVVLLLPGVRACAAGGHASQREPAAASKRAPQGEHS